MRLTRRSFASTLAATAASAALPDFDVAAVRASSQKSGATSLSEAWSVYEGGKLIESNVTLPHVPVALSQHNWDPNSWQKVWTYRRRLDLPGVAPQQRLILHIERAMSNATVRVNGQQVATHQGGFLPFQCEIHNAVRPGSNEIEIEIDARWLNVPPAGSPKGPSAVDYYLPGGINGAVTLWTLPRTAIRDLRALTRDVLSGQPSLDVFADIDTDAGQAISLAVRIVDGNTLLRQTTVPVTLKPGRTTVSAHLPSLRGIQRWSTDSPRLYWLSVELTSGRKPIHTAETRIGFREARFELDGLYLNGVKTRLFGLNRHELFPYVGFSASPRAMRHDAAYLRNVLNCNVVRCSHYPQSTAFLDACDELGLMVWEEIPGWQYLGDEAWKKVALQNVEEMVRRDRHHPSIIVWGTRVNESANEPALYTKTRELAQRLDPTRQTSGSMTPSSRAGWKEHWHEDVFAFDDYHAAADGGVGIDPALPGVPYMLAEAVGQYSYGTAKNFLRRYRRAGMPEEQNAQALLHAQAHDRAAQDERNAGVIAWCAFDYASPMNAYQGMKCPGVVDTFRIPKLGAAFYMAQAEPEKRVVLEPNFYWDANLHVNSGRGAIFSNCEELHIFLNGIQHGILLPDRASYAHLQYAPFFADLPWNSIDNTLLRIDGYIAGNHRISRSFDANHAHDQLWINADDLSIRADGIDSTRVSFGIADRFGNQRPAAEDILTVQHSGVGRLIGASTFAMNEGAAGAVWLRSIPDRRGQVTIAVTHPSLSKQSCSVEVR